MTVAPVTENRVVEIVLHGLEENPAVTAARQDPAENRTVIVLQARAAENHPSVNKQKSLSGGACVPLFFCLPGRVGFASSPGNNLHTEGV